MPGDKNESDAKKKPSLLSWIMAPVVWVGQELIVAVDHGACRACGTCQGAAALTAVTAATAEVVYMYGDACTRHNSHTHTHTHTLARKHAHTHMHKRICTPPPLYLHTHVVQDQI